MNVVKVKNIKKKNNNNCRRKRMFDIKEAVDRRLLVHNDVIVLRHKQIQNKVVTCRVNKNGYVDVDVPDKFQMSLISWTKIYIKRNNRGGLLGNMVVERTGKTIKEINRTMKMLRVIE